MIRTNSTTKISLLFISIIVALTSCEPKPSSNSRVGKNSEGSKLENSIRKDILKLRHDINWDEAQSLYVTINADIDKYVKKKSRGDFHDDANNMYCLSMDTIMYIIMSGECSSRHKELNEIWRLRTSADYNNISSPLHNKVAQMHKKHEELISFVKTAKSNRQKPQSFNTAYDEDTERRLKSQATTYLNSSPTCKEIKTELTRIQNGAVFNSRRISFCEDVVSLYLKKNGWTQADENIVKSRISFYTNEHSSNQKVLQWLSDIEQFKKEHTNPD